MGRKDIDLDQINRRLGGSSGVGPSPDYSDFTRSNWKNQDELEEGDNLSSGFFVTLAAAMLAVGSGTYFFMDANLASIGFGLGGADEAFVSQADGQCARLWKDAEMNDAALKCYLTTRHKRLCDPRERVHLSKTISRYRQDSDRLKGKLMAGVFKDLANTGAKLKLNSQIESLNKETAESKRVVESLNFQDLAKFDPRNSPHEKMNKATRAARQAEVSHARKLQALAEAGFVSEGDFGWFPDRIVKTAFAKATLRGQDPCAEAIPG